MAESGRTGVLVVLSGLPGVGKTTIARQASQRLDAVHLRIDTIESAMVSCGIVAAAGGWDAVPDAGYQVAYRLAADLLRAGHNVIADSVNPLVVTRQSWSEVAVAADALSLNVEVICSDPRLHRDRVEARTSDLDGLTVPTWEQVQRREYQPWDSPVLRVDTALGIDTAVDDIVAAVSK
ncbi:AAA family ATPase [Mycolicibacterium sp. XJ870]